MGKIVAALLFLETFESRKISGAGEKEDDGEWGF
jgi:hypothetical protein